MRESDYAFAVAVIRSHENKLLSRADLDSLRGSGSCEKCLGRLKDKGWGGEGGEAAVLEAERQRAWELIREVAPDFDEFAFLLVKNDFHNLKAAMKSLVMQSDFHPLAMQPCLVGLDDIAKAVEEKSFESLPEYMTAAAGEAYTALTEQGDGQLCELILDRAALESAIALAKKTGEPAERLAELEAFAADVRIACRCARMKKAPRLIEQALAKCSRVDTAEMAQAAAQGTQELCDYLRGVSKDAAEALEKSPALFNAYASGVRGGVLEAHKYDPLGIAPLISYIIHREDEIAAVRVILAEIRNGVDE